MAKEKQNNNTSKEKMTAEELKLELNLEPKSRYKKGEYARMSDGMVP